MIVLQTIEKFTSASKMADLPPLFGPTNTVIGNETSLAMCLGGS